MELIALYDIRLRVGSCQNDRGDQTKADILLDVREKLSAIHFWQIQIEQDQIRTRSSGVGASTPQKSQRLHAVTRDVQFDSSVSFAEGFLRQPDIARIVLDQQHFDRHTVFANDVQDLLPPAKANRKVEPCPSCDSTEIRPPCRSTILLQIANPIPVPANSP